MAVDQLRCGAQLHLHPAGLALQPEVSTRVAELAADPGRVEYEVDRLSDRQRELARNLVGGHELDIATSAATPSVQVGVTASPLDATTNGRPATSVATPAAVVSSNSPRWMITSPSPSGSPRPTMRTS